MTVNVNLIVVCGFAGCPWSMEIDRSSGADPMAVHAAYLDHLDEHDPDGAECEAADHWVSVAHQLAEECPSCKAEPGQPHTEYCKLPKWAEHDAEVARALAEDRIPGARGGGLYAGQLYTPDNTRESIRCPRCQRVSHNPNDVREGYCGACHDYTTTHGLYADETPGQIAAEQARIDRFMAGGEDR